MLQPSGAKGTLGLIHHVDVLGEEDHLAHRAGQLGGVLGGEAGLGLTDLADHGEHVLAGLGVLGLVELLLGHQAHEFARRSREVSR